MRLGVLEKKLTEQIVAQIRDVTPGVLVRAYQNGRMVVDLQVGETWAYYDLASLTKVIFTVQAMMWAFEEKKWTLETRASDILPWYPHQEVFIRDLLTHSAGYEWWKPLYLQFDSSRDLEARRHQLRKILIETPIQPQDTSVYSDLDFFVLSFLLESFWD